VPGSSLRGVLRHRVYHIAQALGADEPGAQGVLNSLFGTHGPGGDTACPGKVQVFDAAIETSERVTVQHVAIDRFTGGALEGALFSEAPIWADTVRMQLHLSGEGLTAVEAGLLLHALLDMQDGELPVGGGSNRGNGFLRRDGEPTLELFWDKKKLSTESFGEDVKNEWLGAIDAALQQFPAEDAQKLAERSI
jgi:CRISPR/Cas system CMR subunit Cmr4 (Cas7 group RAMP superfamily)